MNQIKIPGVSKEISQLILGTMMLSPVQYEHSTRLLDAFCDAGGNALDTAHGYGGGSSEMLIGLWMQQRQNRDAVFLIDKGGHPNGRVPRPRLSPEELKRDLDESLIRLRTSYIDLYMLHRDDPVIPVSTIIDYLNHEMSAGRIRAISASNWHPERITAANSYASANGLHGFVSCSNNISLAVPMEPMWGGCVCVDEAGRSWHQENQFPLMPWSSQARGFFSGAWTPEKRDNRDMVRVYYNTDNFERLARATKLAKKYNSSAIQVSLAYVVQLPFPIFPIIGPADLDEMRSSVDALALHLTDSEMEWLNLQREDSPL